jgi:hypothetical protein
MASQEGIIVWWCPEGRRHAGCSFSGEITGGGRPAPKGPGIFWKELPRYFGISRPSVSQAIKRGEKFAKENDVKLLN